MREHYKSNFHRFNLKRKTAGLRPVPLQLFEKKLKEMQNPTVEAKGDKHLKQDSKKRTKTNKPNENQDGAGQAEQGQIKPSIAKPATKAPNALSSLPAREMTEEEMIDHKIATAVKLTSKQSLFDNKEFDSMERNIKYMTKQFGFFFPFAEQLRDVERLLLYLGQKISIGNTCLYCEKGFHSMTSVRDHMVAKSHCMMQWDDKEEYAEFYDFPKDNLAYVDNIDEDGNILDTEKIFIQPGTGQLVLAEGKKVIGHRAFKTYYNQSLHTQAHQQLVRSLMQEHKRLVQIEHQKGVNVSAREYQRRQDISLKTGLQANRQKHYREQNPL